MVSLSIRAQPAGPTATQVVIYLTLTGCYTTHSAVEQAVTHGSVHSAKHEQGEYCENLFNQF